MTVGHWQVLDIILALFVVFYTLRGLQQGLLHQIASIIPWWGAVICGLALSPWLIKPLDPYVARPLLPYIAALAGASLVFGFLTFGVQALNYGLKKTPLSWLSPVLGALLGASYGVLWLGLFIIACSFEPLASQSFVKKSVIVQKGLALAAQIAYFELWKGKLLSAPSWFSPYRYFKT